jgi:uncharacterized protein YbbC (DUF1343 family)
MLWDETRLTWVSPSPNLRSPTEALLYPGIGLLETTNLSVGRGTDRPFEWIGAPWLDGKRLAEELQNEKLPGIRVTPLYLTPTSSVYRGQRCGGVFLMVDDWDHFTPVPTGLAIAATLRRLYPKEWDVDSFDKLLGHHKTWQAIKDGLFWRSLKDTWSQDLQDFMKISVKYLEYQ